MVNVLIDVMTMLQAKVTLNRNEQGHKESENFNSLHLYTLYTIGYTNVPLFCMFLWGEHIGKVACPN